MGRFIYGYEISRSGESCHMSECGICGEKTAEISKCKECGTLFCDDCGDTVEELCEYCQEEEDW
ncbi:MAG: hypothetical protein ACE5G7_04090 [Candidatus Hydrothermarchaeaceae archaeon]